MSEVNKNSSYLFICFLCLYIVLIYSNTLHVPFMLDDRINIVERNNLHLTKITFDNLTNTFFDKQGNEGKLYRPISNLTFALNYYIGQLNVVGYHIVNIFIHLITSIILFKVMLLLLQSKNFNFTASQEKKISCLATVLWAANPIQTQAVTYIVQRMASLSALFYILGLWCFLNFRHTFTQQKGNRKSWFLLTSLFFICAMFSKENAILFPLGIILIEIFFFTDFTKKITSSIVLFISVSLIVSCFLFIIIKFETLFSSYDHRPFNLIQRVLTEPRILFYYLSQIFYPVSERFSILHSFTPSESIYSPFSTILSFAGIAITVIFSFWKKKKCPLLGFAALFFFGHHLVESSIIPLELAFEHRNYLPSFFLFLPVSHFLVQFLDKYKKHNKLIFYFAFIFCTLIIFFFGTSTYLRNKDWQNHLSLWEATVKKSPDLIRPYSQIGWYYTSSNRSNPKRARQYFQMGLNKRASYNVFEKAFLWFNISLTFEKENNLEAAKSAALKSLQSFKTEINKKPSLLYKPVAIKPLADVHYYLSKFFFISENFETALSHIDNAIELQGNPSFYNSKALYLIHLHQYKKACKILQISLSLDHDNWETHFLLGKVLTSLKNYSSGLWFYKSCMRKIGNYSTNHFIYLYAAENRYLNDDQNSGDHFITQFLRLHSVIDVVNYIPSNNKQFSANLPFAIENHTLSTLHEKALSLLQ